MTSELKETGPIWPKWLILAGFLGFALILAIIFIPVLLFAKESARRAHCVSNEKQLLLAMHMYSDDWNGISPMDSTNPTLVGSMQLVTNYLGGSVSSLYCPDDRRPGAQRAEKSQGLTLLNISYSYVPNVKWSTKPASPVLLDRIYATEKGSAWPSDGNHGRAGGNVGFNDDHVEWNEKLPATLKDKNGIVVVLSP